MRQNTCFFKVDFWNDTPETRTALLNLWVPALNWQRFTYDVRRASGALSRPVRSMSDNRVQKTIVSLLALKKRKRLSQFRDETRSSLAPLLHALMRRQRPAASYSGLSKLSTLKSGAYISLKYFHRFFLLCHFFYFCLFPFCTFVSVLSFCL